MKVHVDTTYNDKGEIKGQLYIESDSMQFILKEYTGAISIDKNTGKESEVYNTIGYFTSFQSALLKLLKMKLAASTVETLGEMMAEIKRIEYEIKQTWSVELKDGEKVAI